MEQENILKKLNSVSFLLVKDDNGRTIINIPMWAVVVVLFLVFRRRRRAKRAKRS